MWKDVFFCCPFSSELGTCKTGKAGFWPSLSGKNPSKLLRCSLLARQQNHNLLSSQSFGAVLLPQTLSIALSSDSLFARKRSSGSAVSNTAPYTLHPTPYTLHTTHYTLRTTHCTLHPTPSTLHPTPFTLHPTPYTLHPTPYAPHATGCRTPSAVIHSYLT